MSKDKDYVIQFMDWCDAQGPAGGLYFIFFGTAAIMMMSGLVIVLFLALAGWADFVFKLIVKALS